MPRASWFTRGRERLCNRVKPSRSTAPIARTERFSKQIWWQLDILIQLVMALFYFYKRAKKNKSVCSCDVRKSSTVSDVTKELPYLGSRPSAWRPTAHVRGPSLLGRDSNKRAQWSCSTTDNTRVCLGISRTAVLSVSYFIFPSNAMTSSGCLQLHSRCLCANRLVRL